MKRSKPLARGGRIKSSGKPLKARGPAKAKREKKYKAFLSSAAWKRIRREALERAGHQCEWVSGEGFTPQYRGFRCPEKDKLAVHHLTYVRFGGDELPTDLQVLCKYCHDRLHGLEGKRIA